MTAEHPTGIAARGTNYFLVLLAATPVGCSAVMGNTSPEWFQKMVSKNGIPKHGFPKMVFKHVFLEKNVSTKKVVTG